jgi:hypothetical protein
MAYVIHYNAVNCKYNKVQISKQIIAHFLMLRFTWPVLNVQYVLLGFSHVMYGSCCNVLVYTTATIFRLNEVELQSPINQVWVGGVDHNAIQWEEVTAARNNNLQWKITVTVVV